MHIAGMEDAPKTPLDRWMRDNEHDDATLAAALGSIGRTQINRLKNGVSRPSLETAEALEVITGIPTLVLLKGADTQQDAAA